MIVETGLAPIFVGVAGLMGGVVLLAGLAGGAHLTAATTTTMCEDTNRPGHPEPAYEKLCGQFPDVAELDGLAGPERGLVAMQAALLMRGVPYSWGGGGPNGPGFGIGHGSHIRGFDCSGLAEYAWAKAGARIGGHTSTQWSSGIHIPRSMIRAGDLVFFARDRANPVTIHHVGIAVDASRMVHAPSTGSTVRVEAWAGVPYREQEFIGAVRPAAGVGATFPTAAAIL